MRLPDDSWLFSTITPDIVTRIVLGMNRFERGAYMFPVGSPVKVSVMPDYSAFSGGTAITATNELSLTSTTSSFSSGNTYFTSNGSTIYSLSGTNNYGDSIILGSASITGSNSPTFKYFSANSLGNFPGSPIQIVYQTQNGTNIALTSNMRAIAIPSDAESGSLIVNEPQDGEIFTLTVTNTQTNTTEQVQITVDNSNKIFSCVTPSLDGTLTGSRTAFHGSGELTFCLPDDGERLYIGRALSTPALMFLGPSHIEMNEVSNMPLGALNFYSDGTPNIVSCDNDKVYFCQPSGGKVTIFDNLSQTAIEEIIGSRPTNIEVNDSFIVYKDENKLRILDKSYSLLSEFTLDGMAVEANDKEIYMSSNQIFVLDGSKVKIIDQTDITVISSEIDLSADYNILSGAIAYSETLNKLFIIGTNMPNSPTLTTITTGVSVDVNFWVYDLINNELEQVNKIQSSDRGDIRYSMRMDIDESRLFIVADWLNLVMTVSTDASQGYTISQKWNTLKPFGIGLSPDGKYLYYSGQDENSLTLSTQRSRHIVIMRLFETQLNLEII